MSQHFTLKDHVSWNTPQGMTHGTIVRVISTRTTVDGRTVDASKSDPYYEVEVRRAASMPFMVAMRCID